MFKKEFESSFCFSVLAIVMPGMYLQYSIPLDIDICKIILYLQANLKLRILIASFY